MIFFKQAAHGVPSVAQVDSITHSYPRRLPAIGRILGEVPGVACVISKFAKYF